MKTPTVVLPFLLFLSVPIAAIADENTSEALYADFSVRIGQGGFRDNRSEIGKLGGGQVTFDIQPVKLPITISLSSEYYTNSPDPTHAYEISNMYVLQTFYTYQSRRFDRVKLFAGGGLGYLEVPEEGNSENSYQGFSFNAEAGINVRAFWRIGVYGIARYLFASKTVDSNRVIDFNEAIGMLGLSYRFSI